MKTDRLLGIVMYLLNRRVVSAAALAERFEVSRRTIQRDIQSLCMAGIPVVSTFGADGGYEIMDGFRLEKGIMGLEDYLNIVTALRGLGSAYEKSRINNTLEKVLARPVEKGGSEARQWLFVDLSVAREGLQEGWIARIEAAVRERRLMRIEYRDGLQQVTGRTIEPLALTYQWYAWYLLAFCHKRGAYRLFKLVRIVSLEVLDSGFSQTHKPAEMILADRLDSREQDTVLLRCRDNIRPSILEYMKGEVVGEDAGWFLFRLQAPRGERLWFSLLLGFGADAEVLAPAALRQKIEEHTQEIWRLYNGEGNKEKPAQ